MRIATASKANPSCLPFQETRDERKLDRHKQQSDSMCKFYLGGYIHEFEYLKLIMHQSFVSTAPTPPMGMGGDNDFSLFRALV